MSKTIGKLEQARLEFNKASKEYHEFRRQLREKTTKQGTPEEHEYSSLQIDWNEYANVKAWQVVERAIAESQAPQSTGCNRKTCKLSGDKIPALIEDGCS